MRKLALALILALLLAAIPSVSFTEDTAAVRLARTIYALAADESVTKPSWRLAAWS